MIKLPFDNYNSFHEYLSSNCPADENGTAYIDWSCTPSKNQMCDHITNNWENLKDSLAGSSQIVKVKMQQFPESVVYPFVSHEYKDHNNICTIQNTDYVEVLHYIEESGSGTIQIMIFTQYILMIGSYLLAIFLQRHCTMRFFILVQFFNPEFVFNVLFVKKIRVMSIKLVPPVLALWSSGYILTRVSSNLGLGVVSKFQILLQSFYLYMMAMTCIISIMIYC